ncbi:hypothetical protein [Hymenobacter glacialis]|nr:hypothetical protein [Hymenobacter glacialis]
MLFSAIAGGAMTAQNLKGVGQPAAARKALWGSIGYTVVVLVLVSFLPEKLSGSWLPIIIGYAGAMGLEAYFKKFTSNWSEFPKKGIGKALLICLAISVPLIALVIYSLTVDQS